MVDEFKDMLIGLVVVAVLFPWIAGLVDIFRWFFAYPPLIHWTYLRVVFALAYPFLMAQFVTSVLW